MEMSKLTQDGTAEPVSRGQILRRERGQENVNFPCSVDHEKDWQLYPVDPSPAINVMTIQYLIGVEKGRFGIGRCIFLKSGAYSNLSDCDLAILLWY